MEVAATDREHVASAIASATWADQEAAAEHRSFGVPLEALLRIHEILRRGERTTRVRVDAQAVEFSVGDAVLRTRRVVSDRAVRDEFMTHSVFDEWLRAPRRSLARVIDGVSAVAHGGSQTVWLEPRAGSVVAHFRDDQCEAHVVSSATCSGESRELGFHLPVLRKMISGIADGTVVVRVSADLKAVRLSSGAWPDNGYYTCLVPAAPPRWDITPDTNSPVAQALPEHP